MSQNNNADFKQTQNNNTDYAQIGRILTMFLSLSAEKKAVVMKEVNRMLAENKNKKNNI